MGACLPNTGILGGVLGVATDGILCAPRGGPEIAIDIGIVPDDGGIVVTATGPFGTGDGYVATIVDTVTGLERDCYSGVIGQGSTSVSDAGAVSFVVPPFPIGGPYDIRFTPTVGAPLVASSVITYIHRTFETNLFSLRAHQPPPRQVGPYSMEEED